MSHFGQTHEDLRVVRTRQLIQEALIDLTIKQGFATITVRDLTNHAHVNRATFYRHYRDKFDLVDQFAQDVYELLDAADSQPAADAGDRPAGETAGLVRMFEHIHAHARFYRAMLGENGDPAFVEKIRYYIQMRLRRALPEMLARDKAMAEVYLRHSSGGSVGVVRWWLEQDMPFTSAEMAALSFRLAIADLQAIVAQVGARAGAAAGPSGQETARPAAKHPPERN